jgi:hypothetical protein
VDPGDSHSFVDTDPVADLLIVLGIGHAALHKSQEASFLLFMDCLAIVLVFGLGHNYHGNESLELQGVATLADLVIGCIILHLVLEGLGALFKQEVVGEASVSPQLSKPMAIGLPFSIILALCWARTLKTLHGIASEFTSEL